MLDRAKFRAASQSFRLLWLKTMQKNLPPELMAAVALLCMKIHTMDDKVLLRWFESLPLMRHWVGDRIAHELSAEGFEARLKPWENTLKVLRDDLMFDRLNGYAPTIKLLANEVLLLPYRLMCKVIADGFTGTLYGNTFDGYPLFSNNHPTGDNYITPALASASLTTAIDAFNAYIDPGTGDLLMREPTHLWFHPALKSTAEDLLDLKYVSDGTTTVENKHYKKLAPLPLKGMPATAAKYWGLLHADETEVLKPVLFLDRPGSDEFVEMDQPEAEPNFMRRELLYGCEYWANAAPAFPFVILGSDGTT